MMLCLYLHGGSKNHGCEALVRSTFKIIKSEMTVYSFCPDEDAAYGIDRICHVESNGSQLQRFSPAHMLAKLMRLITGRSDGYYKKNYSNLLKSDACLYLSIGGDNYCYKGNPEVLAYINKKLNQRNAKTVLWGCSIEPELLGNASVIKDLNHYSLITARESITYNALKQAGVATNIKLYPDPAFQLDKVELPLPKGFVEGNTVGINISPLIMRCEEHTGITLKAYEALIRYIINNTDMQIALIPHVVKPTNDDRKPLKALYDTFQSSGRVILIEDHNCMELKGYIARCRFFIGARTHATIAAYSTCVPTLVVGYSVKAKGIAQDIFGTYENYVVPVQALEQEEDLITAFEWLYTHEGEIGAHLKAFMPAYIEKAAQVGEELRKLL